jgi:outer membrane protein assembly factor BamB
MKKLPFAAGLLAILSAFNPATAAVATAEALRYWPQWRGPLANGVAPEADPPLEWSETKNVKWKVKIPGEGSSTPAIWGDRIFVLTAVATGKRAEATPAEAGASAPADPPSGKQPRPRGPGGPRRSEKPAEEYQFLVLCLDRATGQTLWQKVARQEVPHEGHQPNNTFASASPVTDGQRVFAFFGSRGLYCYDREGNLKWSRDFGRMQTRNGFGEGASPALHGDTLVVNWDDETDNDFIVALDRHTGRELWKTPRDEDTTWSTPLMVEYGGKVQVIVNATRKVRSYDLATGRELWSCAGQTANAIPSPVADADTVYVTSGFRGSALFAIALGRGGDLTGTEAVRWRHDRDTPYVPSPLLVDDLLYVVKVNSGILSCFDKKTGQPHYEAERLDGLREIYASPVAAKDRVYVLGRDGVCLVLKKSPKLEMLATNKLDDRTDASMALAGRELFVRGREYLYCIASP